MAIVHKEYSFPSYSGICDIYAQSWAPKLKRDCKAIMIVAHGMAEHGDRYEDFGKFMARKGIAVFINDHIGHGKTAKSYSSLGYFGLKNDCGDTFIEDMRTLEGIARHNHLDVPVFIFGHSMGSFIARRYISKYKDIDGAIICGTSGPNSAAPVAIKICDKIIEKKGERHYSKLLDKLAFMGYNSKTQKRTDHDWLTRRDDIVDKYNADPKCGFIFTARGYRDLFTLLESVSYNSWLKLVPTTLPILMISGDFDPVGDYGYGVNLIYNKLVKTNHNVELKLYTFARHEILNELHADETYNDVLNFILKNIEE